jgi:hypothetical protein
MPFDLSSRVANPSSSTGPTMFSIVSGVISLTFALDGRGLYDVDVNVLETVGLSGDREGAGQCWDRRRV